MSNYVQVRIVCPCGRLLNTRNNDSTSTSTTRGVQFCPSCRKNVAWQVTGANAYTSYKD